jgi:DNA-3-methyladenine glycosylase II
MSQVWDDVVVPKKSTEDMYLENLCCSIVSQQLSVKAASTIWARAREACNFSSPDNILEVPNDVLRSAGLSGQKINYVKNIAKAVQDGSLPIHTLDTMDDEAVIKTLVTIKGVGRWTAEMFMIFSLGREDVFSAGDLGIRNAMTQMYDGALRYPDDYLQQSLRWAPYRSLACLLLWHSLDNKAL